MKHFSIRVTGRVQGVFFRASTQKAAEQNAVHGFVRNEPDGSVYIEAEGEETDLDRFIEWCKSGPPAARVEKVESREGHLHNFNGFRIDR